MAAPDPEFPFTEALVRNAAFGDRPLRVLDVGARGGPHPVWHTYENQVEILGFEPDPGEYEALKGSVSEGDGSAESGPRHIYYPIALGLNKGRKTLYITGDPNNSSLLRPNRELMDRFHGASRTRIVSETEVETVDVDSFVEEEDISSIDFIKLDVQGTELDVLQGATSVLSRSVLGLSVEVEFLPMYLGQPLFCSVDGFLKTLGFELFNLNVIKWRRKTLGSDHHPQRREGQVAWAEALYLRDLPAELGGLEGRASSTEYGPDRVLKFASLAELFGLPDLAIECLNAAGRTGVLPSERISEYADLLRLHHTETTDDDKDGMTVVVTRLIKGLSRRLVPRYLRTRLKRGLTALVSD
jgi:FkbM family methyltransferase